MTPGANKLLGRDSVNLLMFLSLGVGMLVLFFNMFTQQRGKTSTSPTLSSFLPRPNEVQPPCEQCTTAQNSQQPTENSYYVPLREEEEVKNDSGETKAAAGVSIKVDY